MACPYFCPTSPQAAAGTETAMLPLGDAFAGTCCAVPGQPWQPDPATSRPLCNLGYARGRCDRFPADAGPDAVRFTIRHDDGALLRLYYVLERDHHPFAHGPLEFVTATASFARAPASQQLAYQARAYVASYLRRKAEAGRP
jgi:hypothetical protein